MRSFVILFLCLTLIGCSATIPKKQSINGVSFVASQEAISQKHIDPVVNINANYASIMPFGFIKSLDSPEIVYNTERQWYGETIKGAKQYMKELKKNNIKIMLKPQIWVWRGEFTGDIEMKTEAEWKNLEESYSKFILDFALLAEENKVEIFCIGTELNNFVTSRSEYWNQLIKKIKSVYNGKLTYAENWDVFQNVPFWSDLDFIGIDAYFPLSEKKNPARENLISGWQFHKSKIESLSMRTNKQTLFTEYGYRSVDFTAKQPWDSNRSKQGINLDAQVLALEVLYDEFWDEAWFAGGFLWKWFYNHDDVGGEDNHMFTPQNKPAEKIIKEIYLIN